MEKVALWVNLLCLKSGSETDEGVAKNKKKFRTGNRIRDSGSNAQYAIH